MHFEEWDFVTACRLIQRKREAGAVTDVDYAELDRRFPALVSSPWGSKIISDIRRGDDISEAVLKLMR